MAGNGGPGSRKTTIEIPIPPVRKYVRGSGPPPPRISLAPPRDSTAYIIDQFVLPTEKETTATSRRLIHYHIGFTDLPAVKILIPCDKVLEYVSPRELEDWEYKNSDWRDEERARELARKQKTGAAKKQAGQLPKLPAADAGVSVLRPAEEALLLAKEVAGPSLSTPQKRKLGRMLEEDTGESNLESDDAAIRRQWHGNGESGSEDDLNDSESVDQLGIRYDASAAETPSRAASSVPPLRNSCASSTAAPMAMPFPTISASAAQARPTNSSTPGMIHPAWANAFGLHNRSTQSPNGHVAQNGVGEKTAWSRSVESRDDSRGFTPAGSAATPGPKGKAGSGSRRPASRLSTPDVASAVSAAGSSTSKRKGRPPMVEQSPQGTQPSKKKRKQDIKQKEEPANDEWEVKDLLDDEWFLEKGVKVHKFLVLWEGDWPEDQNPTWEPAENVQDEALTKRYYKKKKAGLLKPLKKMQKQKTLHQVLSGTQYSSVADAFAGDIDQHTGPAAADIDSDTDPPEERFLVTDNAGDVSANGSRPTPTFQSFDGLLARYNQTFSRT